MLLAAGSAGVIGALWPVHDLQASMIIVKFYDCWLDALQSPSHALASAQSWLIESSAAEKATYFRNLPRRFEGSIPDAALTELTSQCEKIASGINMEENDRMKLLYNCSSFYYAGL